VGGTIHYNMIAVEPAQILAHARFAETRPNRRLTITHVIGFVPVEKPYECTIAVDFFPAGENGRMVVTVEPMRDEEFTQRSIKGFISQLRKLEGDLRNSPLHWTLML
jgi:hypothetical protein